MEIRANNSSRVAITIARFESDSITLGSWKLSESKLVDPTIEDCLQAARRAAYSRSRLH